MTYLPRRLDHSDNVKMIALTTKGKQPAEHISFQVLTGCNHQGERSAAPPFLPQNNLTSNMLRLSSTWMHFLHPGYKGRSVRLLLELQTSKLLPNEMMLSSHLSFKPRALERPSRGIRLIPNSPPAERMPIW